MLRALIEAGKRFQEEGSLAPLGFKRFSRLKPIHWVIWLKPDATPNEPEEANIVDKHRPFRQRAGTPGEGNLKPYLLVDDARYALGIPEPEKEKEAALLHRGFRDLLTQCAKETQDKDIEVITKYLNSLSKKSAWKKIGFGDVVTFAVERGIKDVYPFERKTVQEFWVKHLAKEFVSDREGECSSCGTKGHLLQTLPLEVIVMGQKCQITSFNKESFTHVGKEQTLNSPLCFRCGVEAAQTLDHLLKTSNHHVALVRDSPKRGKSNPLRNQVAAFWLKHPVRVKGEENIEIDLEACLSTMLDEPAQEAEAHLTQMEHFLRLIETGRAASLNLPDNAFHLAVLTANKGRLVLREWIEASLEELRQNLRMWLEAQKISGPAGEPARAFPLRQLVRSLYREQDEGEANPNFVRGLLRTAFKGTPPPSGLLEAATQRFGKLLHAKEERPLDREKKLKQLHALAATMKLVLTHGKGGVMYQQDPAYHCGELLAILEEAQRLASRGKIKATLIDRFYGAASSAPASTFAPLIKMAKIAHLAKLRKRWPAKNQELEGLIEKIMSDLDKTGGFPKILPLRQQAYFALGYYCQRSTLRSKENPAQTTPNQEVKQ